MKKSRILAVMLCSCFLTATAHAADVYNTTVKDSKTGYTINYFDLGEETTRAYFTQNMWFNDSKSFAVCAPGEGQIYRYNISTKTAEPLFDEGELPVNSGIFISSDNTIYGTSNGSLVAKPIVEGVDLTPADTLSMTLPLLEGYEDGSENQQIATNAVEHTENGLTYALINNDRWRSVMTLPENVGGKWCRTTVAQNRKADTNKGSLWYRIYVWNDSVRYDLNSSYHTFRVDSSRISTDTREVTVEFDYYDYSEQNFLNNCAVQIIYRAIGDDGAPVTKTKDITKFGLKDVWKSAKVTLNDAYFDHGGNDNGFKFDFRLGSQYGRGGLAVSNVKVYETPEYATKNLGYANGGWHPHVAQNGDVSLTTGADENVVIYDASTKKITTTAVGFNSAHAIINPVYPNLVLYTYEGTGDANTNFNRMNVLDRDTGEQYQVFDQYSNSSDGATTGEAVGHESWTADGEYIVAVKYDKDTNIGRRGIIRMDKNGQNREYINADYNYWHCAPSPDGRWIVADTIPRNDYMYLVMIDSKTGKSHLITRLRAFVDDPGQPHPSFSPDGKTITFAMSQRKLNSSDENNVVGVGYVDVSSLVNDGQIAEPLALTDYRVSPFKIWYNPTLNRNEVTATVKNIDGAKRDMNLYSAVYDKDGRLVAADVNRYYSSEDGTLSAEIKDADKGETLKCFLWDDDVTPIKSSIDTIKKLRVAKAAPGGIVLSWQHETEMPVLKYEVFRGEEKIGETTDTVYRDYGLAGETQYTYYVRPVYEGFHAGEDGVNISVNIDDLDFEGMNHKDAGSSVAGPKAGVKGSTSYSTVSATLEQNDTTEKGLHFVMNGADSSKDGYTKPTEKGSRDCRKSTSDATSMFCFRLDKNIISADMNKLEFSVTYYAAGGGDINLLYNATDGTTKTVKVVSVGNGIMGWGSWKTATVTVSDAKLSGVLNRNADFILKTTKADTCIYSVSVTPKVSSAINSQRQFVEWTTAEGGGISRVSGTVNGSVAQVTSSAPLKLDVDDTYMYGGGNNMAWVDVTYKDQGKYEIYLYYNTSDPTAGAAKADKKATTVITCTNTGEFKTVRIPLIDAGFSNYDGYDLSIGTSGRAQISSVRVLGY